MGGVQDSKAGRITARSGLSKAAVTAAAASLDALATIVSPGKAGAAAGASGAAGEGGASALSLSVGQARFKQVTGSSASFESSIKACTAAFKEAAAHCEDVCAGRESSRTFGVVGVGLGLANENMDKERRSHRALSSLWLGYLQLHVANLIGKMAAVLIAGPHVSYEEEEISPLLRSSLFAAGVQLAEAKAGSSTGTGALLAYSDVTGLRLGSWEESLKDEEDGLKRDSTVHAAGLSTPRAEAADKAPTPLPSPAAVIKEISADDSWLSAVLAAPADDAGSLAGKVLAYMNKLIPENAMKRRQGVFVDVELPLFLALLKHTGTVAEVRSAIESGAKDAASDVVQTIANDVRFVRAYLRRENNPETATTRATGSEDAAAAAPAADPALARKVKVTVPRSFAALRAAMRARALFLLSLAPAASAIKEDEEGDATTPTTDASVLPPGVPRVGSSLSGTALTRVLSSTGALPPPATGPTLARHRSSERGRDAAALSQLEDKWSSMFPAAGIETLLMRHASSTASRSDSTGAAGGAAGGAVGPGPRSLLRQTSWSAVSDDAEPSSGAGDAESAFRDEIETMAEEVAQDMTQARSERDVVVRAIKAYVKFGIGGSPALLGRLLQWRFARASARSYGLAALASLFASTPGNPALASTALLHLRASMRGTYERLNDAAAKAARAQAAGAEKDKESGKDASKDKKDSEADASGTWLQRHFLMNGLEGVSSRAMAEISQAHAALYTQLGHLLAYALSARRPQVASLVMWAWAVDASPRQHGFLARSGILTALGGLSSLPAIAMEHLDDGAPSTWGPVGSDRVSWRPWRMDHVIACLSAGTITKFDILCHIAAAPDAVVAKLHPVSGTAEAWLKHCPELAATSPDGSAPAAINKETLRAVAAAMSISQAADVYAAFSAPAAMIYDQAALTAPEEHRSLLLPASDPEAAAKALARMDVTAWDSALTGSLPPAEAADIDDEEETSPAAGGASSSDSSSSSSSSASASSGTATAAQKAAEEEDKTLRSKRPKRTRSNMYHEKHSSNPLALADNRARDGYSCDVCGGRINAAGCVSYADSPSNWDCCEACFARRSGAEPWEKSPIEAVTWSSSGSAKAMVGPPGRYMKVYSDSSDPTFSTTPMWMMGTHRDWVRTIQFPKSGGGASNKTVATKITVNNTAVRVWLLIPDSINKGSLDANKWLRDNFEATVQTVTTSSFTMNLWRSKKIYAPAALLPKATTTAAKDKSVVIELNGLGASSGSNNYAVVLEEYDPKKLQPKHFGMKEADLEASVSDESSTILPRTLVPTRKITALRRASFALLRVLMAMSVASADGEGDSEKVFASVAGGDEGGAAASNPPSTPVGRSASAGSTGSASSSSTAALHKLVFTLLKTQLHYAGAALKQQSGEAKTSPSSTPRAGASSGTSASEGARKIEVIEAEALAVGFLEFLLSVADTPAAKAYLAAADYLDELMVLFANGSPRIQRMVFRVLRATCTRIHPADLEHALRKAWPLSVISEWEGMAAESSSDGSASGAGSGVAGKAVIGWLFDLISAPALPASGVPQAVPVSGGAGDEEFATPASAAGAAGDHLLCAQGAHEQVLRGAGKSAASTRLFGAGNVSQAVASEAVAFARTVLSLQGWRQLLIQPLQLAVIEAGAAFAKHGDSSPAASGTVGALVGAAGVDSEVAARALAALSILGGHNEPLRVGGRVNIAPFRLAPPAIGSAGKDASGSGKKDAKADDSAAGSGSGSWSAASGLLDLEATIVRLPRAGAGRQVHVVYTRDLSATPAAIDASRLLPVNEVAAPANVLSVSPALLSAFKGLLALGSSGSEAILPLRIHHMALQVLAVFVRSNAGLAAALNNDLLSSLYTTALRPVDLPSFVSVPVLLAKLRALEARAFEQRPALADAASPVAAAESPVVAGGASAGSAAACAATPAAPAAASAPSLFALIAEAGALATEADATFAFARNALLMHNGDAAAARVWMELHAPAYGFAEAASKHVRVEGQFLAFVPLADEKASVPLPKAKGEEEDAEEDKKSSKPKTAHPRTLALLIDVPALTSDAREKGESAAGLSMRVHARIIDVASGAPSSSAAAGEAHFGPLVTALRESGSFNRSDDDVFKWVAKVTASSKGSFTFTVKDSSSDSAKTLGSLEVAAFGSAGSVALNQDGLTALIESTGLAIDEARKIAEETLPSTGSEAAAVSAPIVPDVFPPSASELVDSEVLAGVNMASSSSSSSSADETLLADSDLIPSSATGDSSSSSSSSSKASAKKAAPKKSSTDSSLSRAGLMLDRPFSLVPLAPAGALELEDAASSAAGGGGAASASSLLTNGVTMVEYLVVKRGGSYRTALGMSWDDYSTGSYVGSDSKGWSYLDDGRKGNNGSWDNMGAGFKEGDRVKVVYKKEASSIEFFVNDVSHGVAWSNIPSTKPLFPAITMSNTGDEIKIIATAPAGVCWDKDVVVGGQKRIHSNFVIPDPDKNPFLIKATSGSGSQSAIAMGLHSALADKFDDKYCAGVIAFEQGATPGTVIKELRGGDSSIDEEEALGVLRQLEALDGDKAERTLLASLAKSGMVDASAKSLATAGGDNYHLASAVAVAAAAAAAAGGAAAGDSKKVSTAAAGSNAATVVGAASSSSSGKPLTVRDAPVPAGSLVLKATKPATLSSDDEDVKLLATHSFDLKGDFLRFDAVLALADEVGFAMSQALKDKDASDIASSGAYFEFLSSSGQKGAAETVIFKSASILDARQLVPCAVNVYGVERLTVRLVVSGAFAASDVPASVTGVLLHAAFRGAGPSSIKLGTLVAVATPDQVSDDEVVTPDGNALPVGVLVGLVRPPAGHKVSSDAPMLFRVRMCDTETGVVTERNVPASSLYRMPTIHGVPMTAVGDAVACDAGKLRASLTSTLQALSTHAARSTLQSLLVAFARHAAEQMQDRALRTPTAASTPAASALPAFTLANVGGADRILRLIKLVAASDPTVRIGGSASASAAEDETSKSSSSSSSSVAEQLAAEAAAMASDAPSSASATEAVSSSSDEFTDKRRFGMASLDGLRGVLRQLLVLEKSALPTPGEPILSDVLVSDLLSNFVSAIQPPVEQTRFVESSHPLPAAGVYTGVISLPGAMGLEVAFAGDCALDSRREEAIYFYSSPAMTDASLLAAFSAKEGAKVEAKLSGQGVKPFPAKAVKFEASSVYWKLVCGPGAKPLAVGTKAAAAKLASSAASDSKTEEEGVPMHQRLALVSSETMTDAQTAQLKAPAETVVGYTSPSWGVSFVARPATGSWQCEAHALSPLAPSLGWASWLLGFMLNEVAVVLKRGAVHNQRMYDALVRFLRTPGADSAVKQQVVALLSQLLIHPHMFERKLDLSSLSGIESVVIGAAEKALGSSSSSSSKPALPTAVQALIELVIARYAAESALKAAEAVHKAATTTTVAAYEPFPGYGAGVLLRQVAKKGADVEAAAAAAAAVSRPERLDMTSIIRDLTTAWPEISEDEAAEATSAWEEVTNGNRTGFVTLPEMHAHPDATHRVMLEAMYLFNHPEVTTPTAPADAVVDFYDFVEQTMLMVLGDSSHATPADKEASTNALQRLMWLAARVAKERKASVDISAPSAEPPKPPAPRMRKPWVEAAAAAAAAASKALLTAATPGQGVVMQLVRPHADAANVNARVLVPAPTASLHTAAEESLKRLPAALTAAPSPAAGAAGGAAAGSAAPAVVALPQSSLRLVALDVSSVPSSGTVSLDDLILTPGTVVAVRGFAHDNAAHVGLLTTLAKNPVQPLVAVLPFVTDDLAASAAVFGEGTEPDDSADARARAVAATSSLAATVTESMGGAMLVLLVAETDFDALVDTATRAAASDAVRGITPTVAAAASPSEGGAAAALGASTKGALAIARFAAKAAAHRDASRLAKLQRGLSAEHLGASTAAAFASLSGRGTSGVGSIPVKPRLPDSSSTAKLLDQLLWVHELSSALYEGGRPRDEILCSAWMDAIGEAKYVESNHPYRRAEVLAGEVQYAGATSLKLVFNPRCATATGVSLTITYGSTTKTFTGPAAQWGDDATASDKVKPGNWPKEPLVITGSRVRYAFRVADKPLPAGQLPWGIGFTIVPVGMASAARSALLTRRKDEILFAARQLLTQWTRDMDAELADLARTVLDKVNSRKLEGSSTRFTLANMPLAHLCLPDESCDVRYPALVASEVPLPQMRMRFALLRMFNQHLQRTLPAFALGSTREWSVGYRIRALSHCIFLESKQSLLDAALKATEGSGAGSIELSNFRATASEHKGEVTPETSMCMFVQAYKQLRDSGGRSLRGVRDSGQMKVFDARFEGESGIDAGGVYREAMSRIMDDLFSATKFNLLIPCANNRRAFKVNTDAFLPNPAHATPLALSQLEFVGRLMGVSLRTKATMPFFFTSIVWKAMIGERPTFADLAAMDGMTAELLTNIRDCNTERMGPSGALPVLSNDAEFTAFYPDLRFTIIDAAGKEAELMPGGKDIPVTFTNRMRFFDAAVRFRLHEFDVQLAAMKRGLANIVPISALRLFTWQEVETLVCGKADIDLEYLRKHTRYEGYSESSEVIKSFWRVVATFTPSEKQQLIRFAWGRSRLPPEGTTWTAEFKITTMSGGDKALPMAHTCFATIDLPAYTTDERMAWGLRTAMAWGIGGILNG